MVVSKKSIKRCEKNINCDRIRDMVLKISAGLQKLGRMKLSGIKDAAKLSCGVIIAGVRESVGLGGTDGQ